MQQIASIAGFRSAGTRTYQHGRGGCMLCLPSPSMTMDEAVSQWPWRGERMQHVDEQRSSRVSLTVEDPCLSPVQWEIAALPLRFIR